MPGWDTDPVDFGELRLQPLGQQQVPVHAEQSYSPEQCEGRADL